MATHSSILARRIPWTEEPGGLQSMGSQRVRHKSAYTGRHAQRQILPRQSALVLSSKSQHLPITSPSQKQGRQILAA